MTYKQQQHFLQVAVINKLLVKSISLKRKTDKTPFDCIIMILNSFTVYNRGPLQFVYRYPSLQLNAINFNCRNVKFIGW